MNIYGLPYVRTMKKRPVVAGDTLIVHCPVAGYPIDSIVWERDGRFVYLVFSRTTPDFDVLQFLDLLIGIGHHI